MPTSNRARRIVALVGHAPALWLCYSEQLSPPLKRANAIAIGLSLAALAVALSIAPPAISKLVVGVIVWAVCYVGWGAYLAWRL